MLGNIRSSISAIRISRGIRTNAILRDVKPATASTSSTRADGGNIFDSANHVPTEWEKRMLVWTKTYPNKEAIPARISLEKMQAAMSRGRIRVANYMMIVTVLACAYVIYQGRQHSAEVSKDAATKHSDLRRQISAEYRASLKEDESKK